MAEDMEKTLIMEHRSRMRLTGVTGVDSFNEEMATLTTEDGQLTVLGGDLKIGHLDLDSGQVYVEGQIDALSYKAAREKGSLWRRLLR